MKKFFVLPFFLLAFFLLAHPVRAEANPLDPCPLGESRYRPGGVCERLTPQVYVQLDKYPLTCQDIPDAVIDGSGLFQPPNPIVRNLTSDISQAELGGLGPNQTAINGYSPDALAQIYMFNGLFDEPISMKNESREAARTYWRLMNSYQQANAKADWFITVKKSGYVNNTTVEFYNPDKPVPGVNTVQGGSSIVPANPKLGFNIGYGSIDPKYCDDAAGRPVTFLVDLHSTNLSDFANCYSRASIRIVRITGLKADTPPSDFAAAGSLFNATFGNDYVELGNELNSIDVEYPCSTDLAGCGASYAAQFAAFRSTFTGPHISAAALNVGNGINDPVVFLQGAKPAYTASTFLANNAYSNSAGCVFEPIRCSKDSYKWFSQFIGSSAPVVLTEYGLAPPNDDKNLNNVLAFYKDLPNDVIAITPLIRNVCPKAAGEWLHFNQSNNLVDAKDNVVDPTTCSSASSDNYLNDKILVLDLKKKLPLCLTTYPVCDDYANVYLKLPIADRNAYDSMLPFNFDNVRGYEVVSNIVYKENLPYVKAITDALNSRRVGLLNLLSPQWMNDLRQPSLTTRYDETDVTKPNTPDNPGFLDYQYAINSDQEGGYVNDSQSLPSRIINRAKGLNYNDCLIHDHGTYLPSPLTYPVNIDKTQLNVKLNQDVSIPITIHNDQGFDPLTGLYINHYSWTGSAAGAPVAVLNSPKLQDLSTLIKGPESLTAMFIPNAGYNPNRDLVAPIAILASSNPDTKVAGQTFKGGQARIGRTAGESQTTICELRNKWLIPEGLQKNNVNCVDPYQTLVTAVQSPGISNVNIPTEANCNKNAPAGNPGNLLPETSLENIGFPSGADKNNIKNCYNDLVGKANAAGYDPAFVMAIWLEESAASQYSSYPDVADFGCAVNYPKMDYNAQIGCFLNLKGAYSNRPQCLAGGSLTYEDFLLIFSEGYSACKNADGTIPDPDGKCFDKGDNPVSHYRKFCSNPLFPDRISNYYQLVTGGKSLNLSSGL